MIIIVIIITFHNYLLDDYHIPGTSWALRIQKRWRQNAMGVYSQNGQVISKSNGEIFRLLNFIKEIK